jgi:secondary thiamine-phosphate synthase enzyme
MEAFALNGELRSSFGAASETLRVQTRKRLEFIDITERAAACVARSRIGHGLVSVQTRHTTTGIVINENEPLLLEDLERVLARWAPVDLGYRHDDMEIRTVNLVPGERSNGDAHARALALGTSECLNIVGGAVQLGRWQRVFLVELDGPREREISITALGLTTFHDRERLSDAQLLGPRR